MESIAQILEKHQNVLVAAGDSKPLDTLPSALAICEAITRRGKKATLYYPKDIPEKLAFLSFDKFHAANILINRDCVVTINTSSKPVEKIKYLQNGEWLQIVVTPKNTEELSADDFRIEQGTYPYDAIIAVGIPEPPEALPLYNDYPKFFQETPRLNIVDYEASSCAEVLTRALKETDEELVVKDVATPLFTGLVAATKNFQEANIRPQTLFAAAYLIAKEADQQTIVRALYKTKPLELIRLSGKAMSHLAYESDIGVGHSRLRERDFTETGARPSIIPQLIEEIRNNFSQARFLIVGWEDGQRRRALLHATEENGLQEISVLLGGTPKHNFLLVDIAESDIEQGMRALVDKIREAGV